MTGPDNSQAATRPVSVAELLAKNGTIGSPPVGGVRRRRRRGKNDAVTVAELTGEIPIVRMDDLEDSGELPIVTDTDTESGSEINGSETSGIGSAVAYEPSRLERAAEPTPRRGRDAPPERSEYPRPIHHRPDVVKRPVTPEPATADSSAESMSPDPIDDAMVIVYQSSYDVIEAAAEAVEVTEPDELGIGVADFVREDLVNDAVNEVVSDAGLLFSGDTMADEMARGTARFAPADGDFGDVEPIAGDLSDDLVGDLASNGVDTGDNLDGTDLTEVFGDDHDEFYDYYEKPSRGRLILRGLAIVAQSIVSVAFGAGLFLAFDQLWQWNSPVAMVLAILTTLGLVAGVWVVRKTEDIASTLIAVGVGLLVTFGPLALMHAT